MIPERRRIRNEGDRQELMAEELAGGDMEGEELRLGQERRPRARLRPHPEVPEEEAPVVETSEGATFGVETGEVGEVRPRSNAGGGGRRSQKRRSSPARSASSRGKVRASTRRRRGSASAAGRRSSRSKAAVTRCR